MHTHAEQVASGQLGYCCFDQAANFGTEMACGVHLGIVLIFLVQAEHVRCLWASQAQSSQRQNGNAYVGYSQRNSGLGDSSPQNKLRQASVSPGSAQSSSLNTRTAVISGYSQGLSSSGPTQTVSQPAKSGYASVRLVHSSSVSKPNWQTAKLNRVNEPNQPKKFFGLSTAIASGSSVSKYDKNPSKRRTRPVQQDYPRTSKYQSSSYTSVQSPSRESYSFKSAAQKAPAAAQTTYKSSSLFSSGAPAPNRSPVRTKTSASAPARRVPLHRGSEASKPSSFSSLQSEGSRRNPGPSGAGKPYRTKLFPVNAGNAQESYKPTSTSNMASGHVSYGQSSVSNKQSAQTSFQPRGVLPSSQRLSYSRNLAQGAGNAPASGGNGAGTSGQRFAPTRVHNIPESFGGSPIRRLRDPERGVSVRKPQPTYVASLRQAARQSYVAPQQQAAPEEKLQENKWKRIRMRPQFGQ